LEPIKNIINNKNRWVLLSLIATILLPLVVSDPFILRIMILIFMFGTLGSAWNILGGFAGQISLGHAAYFGLGAYISALLVINKEWNPWLAMLLAGLCTVAIACALGVVMFNIAPWYFTISTIALGEIVYTVFLNWEYAGGALGLYLPLLEESWKNFTFAGKAPYYYISFAILILSVMSARKLELSRAGFYFRAIRDDHTAAASLGVEVFNYKLLALAASAFFSAIAGSFYAQYVLYIDPESMLTAPISMQIMLTAAIGGVGTILGPIIGAAILIPLGELTRVYAGGGGRAIDLVLFSVLLLGVAILQPKGIMGFFKKEQARDQ